jgi:signal peptidase I
MGKYQKGFLWTVGLLGGAALILRALLFKVWTVPDDPVLGASVGPTLAAGDVVLVLTRGTPGFGDLVRCRDPEEPTRFVVGRVAGVEGDTVETDGFRLTVNNRKYDSHSACPERTFRVPHPSSGSEMELNCDVVDMGGGWHYRGHNPAPVLSQKTRADVGAGMVYLLSDNREHHDDSRDFGQLPRSSCAERVVFRLWGKSGWGDTKRRMTFIH